MSLSQDQTGQIRALADRLARTHAGIGISMEDVDLAVTRSFDLAPKDFDEATNLIWTNLNKQGFKCGT